MRRLVAVVAVSAAVLSSGACSVQTLGAPKGDFVLYAVFDDVQNLVAGHSVQISDVPVGSVAEVRLDGYRARVTMSIVDGVRVPAGTTATLAKASLLGENLVRLDPPPDPGARFLASGATIAETAVQPGLEQVSERVAPVIAALGGQDLNEIVTGLSTGLEGQGPRLNEIIDQAAEISDDYAAANRDLAEVIDGMGRLGRSLAESGPALDRLPGLLVETTARVEKDRGELKQAVKDLTEMASAVNAQVGAEHGERLRRLLLRLDAVLGKMIKGKDQLKAFTAGILDGFAKAPSMTNEGQALIHVWLNGFLPAAPARGRPDFADTLEELMGPR
ncbi:MCE family protein [Actinocorallia populi]|uniref:MCE family protein n=1 Tax=Actinocorallia populi TaxID=2079200 RepID=UPI0013006457|nr:MCE family protein [Actinocorallia populi]